jgi:hypothetical protein
VQYSGLLFDRKRCAMNTDTRYGMGEKQMVPWAPAIGPYGGVFSLSGRLLPIEWLRALFDRLRIDLFGFAFFCLSPRPSCSRSRRNDVVNGRDLAHDNTAGLA